MNHDTLLFKNARKLAFRAWKKFPSLRWWRFKYWEYEERKYREQAATFNVNPHMVLFDSFGGRQYSDSPRAIYEEMISDERFNGWTFFWAFKRESANRFKEISELRRATILIRGTKEYFDVCAQTKFFVMNNRLMEYIVPKEDQVYIQCWHGTPLKKLGMDNIDSNKNAALNSAQQLADRFAKDAEKWSYLLSPSDYTSDCLCSAFGLPKAKRDAVVLKSGYPRNDFIRQTLDASDSSHRLEEIKKRLGIPLDKKILLFAPTWRDDQYQPGEGYTCDLPIDVEMLQKELANEWVLLLRLHYYIAKDMDISRWNGFAFDVSDVEDINHLYVISDVLCTDYSSVFFDYANTRRPLVFYWPDREHYESELHGFYFNPDTIPGPKCDTPAEVCAELKSIETWEQRYGESYSKFIATFCPLDDGEAAQRVIRAVLG